MSRKVAREIAMKLAFAKLLGGGGDYEEILSLSDIAENSTEKDHQFAADILSGIAENQQSIDRAIGAFAHGWTVERMPLVDVCILRVAVYEMLYGGEVSDGVAINEAVELAKRFGGDRSPAFINGVLGGISRGRDELKALEEQEEKERLQEEELLSQATPLEVE